MIAQLFVLLAVLVAALAQPALPTLPAQYMVENIYTVIDTNAGYPPHYTETDSAQYFDYNLQMTRTDVKQASYGQKGPYTIISNYAETFPMNCGPNYQNMDVSRGYMIANGKCCYTPLVSDCPSVGPQSSPPMADTMYDPLLPKKIAYIGTVDSTSAPIPAGDTANYWQSLIYAGQTVPVIEEDFYFDPSTASPATQLASYLHVVLGPQFINATVTYNGAWTFGPQAAELFDISGYDCSKQCSSSVSDNVRNAGIRQRNHHKN